MEMEIEVLATGLLVKLNSKPVYFCAQSLYPTDEQPRS
jgi:hypothetical protein